MSETTCLILESGTNNKVFLTLLLRFHLNGWYGQVLASRKFVID